MPMAPDLATVRITGDTLELVPRAVAARHRLVPLSRENGRLRIALADPLDTDGIARTGEEDPLAMVDDPDMAAVIAAQLAQKRANALPYDPEPAESDLIGALDTAEPLASAALEREDFAAAMSALASLRAPIDRFFTEVIVNAPEADKRAARLDLLLRFRDAVHQVADFSRIEG